MLRVAGVYDGKSILLHEPLPIPLHATVEILVAEEPINLEDLYWQRLVELGLVKLARPQPARESAFAPIQVVGAPVSQTIIEERR